MIKHYTPQELESFVKGMIRASKLLKSEKPDHFLAPITGAVPFVDVLAIVDRHFDFDSVQYVPSTSKLEHLTDLMEGWYTGFLNSTYHDKPLRIATLDEVVGGSSSIRAYDAFSKGISNVARETVKAISGDANDLARLVKKMNRDIKYLSVGIVEEKRGRIRQNKRFNRLVKQGKIKEVPVEEIVTMDRPELCPLKLKFSHYNGHGRSFYKPEIESFTVGPEYIAFLQDVARCVGVDPSTVSPVNVSKIANFKNFIPIEFLEE